MSTDTDMVTGIRTATAMQTMITMATIIIQTLTSSPPICM